MMKGLKRLVAAQGNMTVGNHAVKFLNEGGSACFIAKCKWNAWGRIINREIVTVNGYTRLFTYHDNEICLVDDVNHLVILTHAGWHTMSTTRALNDYRNYFVGLGYKVVEDI